MAKLDLLLDLLFDRLGDKLDHLMPFFFINMLFFVLFGLDRNPFDKFFVLFFQRFRIILIEEALVHFILKSLKLITCSGIHRESPIADSNELLLLRSCSLVERTVPTLLNNAA